MPRFPLPPFYTVSLLLVALLLAAGRSTHGTGSPRLSSVIAPPTAPTTAADTLRPEWQVPLAPRPSLLLPPAQGWSAYWLHGLDAGVAAQRDSLHRLAVLAPLASDTAAPDSADLGIPAAGAPLHTDSAALFPGQPSAAPAADTLPHALGGLAAAVAQHTGLEIRVQGRSALGGAWNRMRPCTGLSTPQCESPLVPRIAPDMQLGAVVRGTLFERVHLAVDYDAAREFNAANQIHVHYQGEQGELLRRVEAGNVALLLPPSRFLTRGVPAGNWGLRALGQAGPLEVQALWAQQSGAMTTREFRQSAGSEGLLQEASVAWDDAAYAAGQFFFLFDPSEIRGYPHLDVRALTGVEAPARLLPQGAVQLYRYEGGPPRQDGSTMILRAVPREPERAQEAVTGPFRLLQAGVDYQLHPSGSWLMLQSPLREEEALGVAYVSLTGESVGQLAGAGSTVGGVPREIRLLKGVRATHQPGSATWPLEMRQVYRVSGSDEVESAAVRLVISRGEPGGGDLGRTHPLTGQPLPYLQLFGLDEEAPAGQLDAARLFRPREEEPGTALRGTYLIFPTLRPFAEPPPLPGARLTAAQAAQLLGGDANPGIYEGMDERTRRAAARFRLSFGYTVRSQGVRSVFSLGAIGIREGSERLFLGGRQLERGVDYEIQYEIGEVQLLNPSVLFAGTTDTELRATFEQMPLFGVAPTSVAGFTARYPLGARGELNFVGLSQREQAFERRPTLGAEPASLLLGGLSGRISLGAPWLDRIFEGRGSSPVHEVQRQREEGRRTDSLPPAVLPSPLVAEGPGEEGPAARAGPHPPAPSPAGGRGGAPPVPAAVAGRDSVRAGLRLASGALRLEGQESRSAIQLSGELAMSLPDPYRQGIAYLEDFEERDEISIPLARQAWRLGSAPASGMRAEGVLPPVLDASTAGTLVWQHDYLDAAGRIAGSLRAGEIDTRIRVAGNSVESSVLYLSFGGGTGPAWRSLTSVLSPTGRDLRNQEYLEFYARGGTGATLVLDLGTVSEDALALDAFGRTGGTDAAGRPWGLGVLDREWDPVGEVWSSANDQLGLWDAACRAEPGATYALGDPRANCTRGNGLADTEDLNGNGVLDTDERVFRQVVRLDDPGSPYLARDTAETRTGFRLYRIPIQREAGAGATPAEIHNVRHLRLTVAGETPSTLALARMRLVGSRWEKRGEQGIAGGLIEAERPPAFPGRLEAGPVSRLTDGDAYLSPPGVVDQPQDPTAAFEMTGGIEYNEKALRLRYSGIAPGDRAEVYRSYEGMPRNFLAYRQLRLWALAREGRWGEGEGEGDEQLVVRVGSGPDNYYLYRTPLPRVGVPRAPQDWGPEIVIDFAPWQRLRAEAERLLLERPAGDTRPLVLWSADSTHAVVVGERGRAPNLAAVRELSLAVWNGGAGTAAGEVWINDIRLGAAQSRPGAAGEVSLAIRGGEVLQTELSYTQQSPHFRQLDGLPGYQGEAMLAFSGALQVGELLPAAWGLDAPLAVSHQRMASEPLYLEQTDLEAELLGEVRHPEARRTRVSFQLGRRPAPGSVAGASALDGLRLRVLYQSADQATTYTASQGADLEVALEYQLRPAARTLPLLPAHPGFWSWLPGPLRSGWLASGLPGLRLRWSPEGVIVGTGWSSSSSDYRHFAHALSSTGAGGAAQQRLQQRLNQQVTLQLRPVPSLGADLGLRSTRDLLASERLNPQAAGPLDAERLRLGGLDLGREADRTLTSRLTWTPRLVAWLTTQATASGSFQLDQNPAYLRLEAPPDAAGDTVRVLLRTFGNNRALSSRFVLDPQALSRALGLLPAPVAPVAVGDSTAGARPPAAGSWLLRSLQPLELSWGRHVESRFDRAASSPGLGYQLGLGGWDDFRLVRADSATRLVNGSEWKLRTEVALPAALRLRLGYGARHGELLGRRSERLDREIEWPDVALEWSALPLPVLAQGALRNVTLGSGYNRRSHRQADRGAGEGRMTSTIRLPFSVSATWNAGLTTGYRAEWTHASGTTPFADTRRGAVDHILSLGGSFAVPGFLTPLFPEPLALALRYTLADRRECRLTPELALCSERNEFLSYQERLLGVQLDTRAAGMSFGVQIDHRDRQSRIGERGANSQFTFGIFGQFDFSAGTHP